MPVEPELSDKSEIVEFADKKEIDFSGIFVWIGFFLSLLFIIFIFLSNSSLKNEIESKENEKAQALSTLNLPENQKVVSDVLGAKSVISVLSQISMEQDTKQKVLENLYGYITKDVKISTISLASDGTVGLDGKTSSYRTVADLMLALKSNKKISEMDLKAVSISTDASVSASDRAAFSLVFKLDLTKTVDEAVTSDADTSLDTTADSSFPISSDSSDVLNAAESSAVQ